MISATRLRQNLYRILDSVLESGVAVEIERNGHVLRIVAAQDDLAISPMVKLELENLYETNRTAVRAAEIIDNLQRVVQLTVDTQSFQQVVDRAMGPKWTRDPFDRIITAQADLCGSILLTKDRTIHNYYVNAAW